MPRTNPQSTSAKSTQFPAGPPTKPKSTAVRTREYLTPAEMKALTDADRSTGRHGFRDWLLGTGIKGHALRVGEFCDLRWEPVDFRTARLPVTRLENGEYTVHFIEGDEIRALRKLIRQCPECD